MFSILGPLDGLFFLDLFAGSGIVALEALSRGAAGATLVEKDSRKRAVLLENLKIVRTGEGDGPAILVMQPVERFLRPRMRRFDLVHLDPPFPMKGKARLLDLADRAGQPAPGGTLTIHYPSEENLPEEAGRLRRYDLRSYGRSVLAFYTPSSPG